MASTQVLPENVRLRYPSVSMFEQPDTHSKVVAQLGSETPFTVLGTELEFYRVRLSDEICGFVYAHNIVGNNMPLTANEQQRADARALADSQPPGGWRGLLHRLDPRSPGQPV